MSDDPRTAVFGFDAYSPAEIARRVEESGVAKARLPLITTAMLGMLAGAVIASVIHPRSAMATGSGSPAIATPTQRRSRSALVGKCR
jgi:formate/nitrite transporter FocA (FNT family)